MAVWSRRNTLLVVCVLLSIYRVEGGFRKPPKPTPLKHDYTMELERVDMLSTPSEFYSPDTRYYTKLYNETTVVLEADMYLVKQFPDDVTIFITIFEFNPSRNSWAQTTTKEMAFCEFMRTGSNYLENIFVAGNLTQECPHEPGFYVFRQLLIRTQEFPMHLEETKWRVVVNFYPKSTKKNFLSIAFVVCTVPIEEDDD